MIATILVMILLAGGLYDQGWFDKVANDGSPGMRGSPRQMAYIVLISGVLVGGAILYSITVERKVNTRS
jgi:hypothetical protein